MTLLLVSCMNTFFFLEKRTKLIGLSDKKHLSDPKTPDILQPEVMSVISVINLRVNYTESFFSLFNLMALADYYHRSYFCS